MLIIRADADAQIGAGHVMRCLALADECRIRGVQVVFVGRSGLLSVRAAIEDRGYQLHYVDPSCSRSEDLAVLQSVVDETPASDDDDTWVVLDGYDFDPTYQAVVQGMNCRSIVIDDFGHHDRYHADVLLNQNASAQLCYKHDPGTRLLLGPKYVLLRQEFTARGIASAEHSSEPFRILVTMGLADPHQMAVRVVEMLSEIHCDTAFEIDVVVRQDGPQAEILARRAQSSEPRIRLHEDVTDMAGLMVAVDLAVSAAGSTAWELAHVGVASILMITADNQQLIAHTLAMEGAAINLGRAIQVDSGDLCRAVAMLLKHQQRRKTMAQRASAIVDGLGAKRVVDVLQSSGA